MGYRYRALSVRLPHAGLIALGVKRIELRTWAIDYRGPLLIVSGLRPWVSPRPLVASEADVDRANSMPGGVTLAIVDLLDIRRARPEDAALACVAPVEGELAWILGEARRVTPRSVRGAQRVFWVPAELVSPLAPPPLRT